MTARSCLPLLGVVWSALLLSACPPAECEGPDCDGDGVDDPDDCDDFDAALGARELDSDCDGVLAPGDCDDRDAKVIEERPDGLETQGIAFVSVCAGSFEMGCTSGQLAATATCPDDESPAHDVSFVRDLWVASTPITQGQWSTVMGTSPSAFSDCGEDCPVESMTWWEALAFANELSLLDGLQPCYRLDHCALDASDPAWCLPALPKRDDGDLWTCPGYRLLNEAEWEYAARAGSDLPFAGGAVADDVAWHAGNAAGQPQPVASQESNAWGLYDLSGNVWEWTWDRYGSDYYSFSSDSSPRGPGAGLGRTIRGGSFDSGEEQLRVAARAYFSPSTRSAQVGLRVARTIPLDCA